MQLDYTASEVLNSPLGVEALIKEISSAYKESKEAWKATKVMYCPAGTAE